VQSFAPSINESTACACAGEVNITHITKQASRLYLGFICKIISHNNYSEHALIYPIIMPKASIFE
jgi:hypothetical protein